jgi:hypothetical protein
MMLPKVYSLLVATLVTRAYLIFGARNYRGSHPPIDRRTEACKESRSQFSLRIDLQQTQALPSLAEHVACTAVVWFLTKDRELKERTFDTGTIWGALRTIASPKGGAKRAWYFFLQRKKRRWMQVLDAFARGTLDCVTRMLLGGIA